ncbi:hypothetical protein OJ997_16805 [Solirubrobacter phytolaccae]|uniref:Lipoprotein n=1 Tax=Solirubrobacter phytolaccae TaxID=1404360 RepID=A0A9X3N9L3_9ACTN|nr:hypothetical protein [Solirubrobacter phytolaccae]MDA0181966.1 hypothetical protein [Solirubrobacter phytolaccae]
MPFVRLAACCAALVIVGACGAESRPRPAAAPTATPDPSGLRFVKPPLVTFHAGDDSVSITARLNRGLRHNLGHPGEVADTPVVLDVPTAEHDYLVGMDRDPVRPTCYRETVGVDTPLVDGQPIEVSLVLDEQRRVTTTATLRELADGESIRPERELGCPNREPGLPSVHRCDDDAPGLYSIWMVSARGTSCRRAAAVMRAAERDAPSGGDCYEDLCLRGQEYRGYRCRAALSGEAYWDIVCSRGEAEVRGNAAD